MNMQISAKYFAGANGPGGFYSRFDEMIDPAAARRYIIKGGPGTGKSTLMHIVAMQLTAKGHPVEFVYCSSDPESLDGVVFPTLGAAIVDGTAPHTIDPVYPGATERILNLGEHWDEKKLRTRSREIIRLGKAISAEHAASRRCITAAAALLNDTAELGSRYLLPEKLDAFAERFAKKRLPKAAARPGSFGRDTGRFLTAITPAGFVSHAQTLRERTEKTVLVDDLLGSAPKLLAELRRRALRAGFDTVSYYCPLAPASKLEHLHIPAAGLFVTTCNAYHSCEQGDAPMLHMTRFFSGESRRPLRARFSFNRRAGRALLEEAVSRLSAAKTLHDELEACYADAMDFEKNRALALRLSEEIVAGGIS